MKLIASGYKYNITLIEGSRYNIYSGLDYYRRGLRASSPCCVALQV